MGVGFVLDACSLIAFLNDEDGAEKVEEILCQADRHSSILFLHEVNL